jgi:hypothetical protein
MRKAEEVVRDVWRWWCGAQDRRTGGQERRVLEAQLDVYPHTFTVHLTSDL